MEPVTALTTAANLFLAIWTACDKFNTFFRECKQAPDRVRLIKGLLDSCYVILRMLERAQDVESQVHEAGDRHDDFQLKAQLRNFRDLCERLSKKVELFMDARGGFRKPAWFFIRWKWTRADIGFFVEQLRMQESSLTARLNTTMYILAARTHQISIWNHKHDAKVDKLLHALEETKAGREPYLAQHSLTPVQQSECENCINLYSRVSSTVSFNVRMQATPSPEALGELDAKATRNYNGSLEDFRTRLLRWGAIQIQNTSKGSEGGRKGNNCLSHTAAPPLDLHARISVESNDELQPFPAALPTALVRTAGGRLVPSSRPTQSLRDTKSEGFLVTAMNMPESESRAYIQGHMDATNENVANSVMSLGQNKSTLSLSSRSFVSLQPITPRLSEPARGNHAGFDLPRRSAAGNANGAPQSRSQLPPPHKEPSRSTPQIRDRAPPDKCEAVYRDSPHAASHRASQSHSRRRSQQNEELTSRLKPQNAVLKDTTNVRRVSRSKINIQEEPTATFLPDPSDLGTSEIGGVVSEGQSSNHKAQLRRRTADALRAQQKDYYPGDYWQE